MTANEKKALPALFRLIKKYFRQLVIVNAIVGVLAAVVLLLLPEWYRSTAVVMVEKPGDQLNIGSAAMSNMGLIGGDFAFNSNEEVLRYIRYLSSRRIADRVIERFDLMERWDKKFRADVYKKLNEDVVFVNNEDGSISITCKYKEDPELAADIANYYVDQLMAMINAFEDQYRDYVEEAYHKQYRRLYYLEEEFASFQAKTGIYDLENQSELTFQALTELEIKKMQTEIRRDLLKRDLEPTDPRLLAAERELDIYDKKISTYKNSNDYSNVPVNKLSEQGIDYLRIYRELTIQEKIVQFLSMEYEQAKLDKQKKEVKLNIIDRAAPSDRKFKPKRASSLIIILLISGLLSLIAFNFKESYYS
ncbi:MAG: Wzz/FepE/Etk N-terminal domain-containing protein [Candidatus Marinimicrobia bacterium]|nr:Wzz/FepE/Etk N-terminal domain-containing protein [Candidatus Neomarinimicrobiota bacterium]